MTDRSEDEEDAAHRSRLTLGAAMVVVALIAGCYWVVDAFYTNKKLQDCLMGGWRSCVGVERTTR
jgi:hypothetical protein